MAETTTIVVAVALAKTRIKATIKIFTAVFHMDALKFRTITPIKAVSAVTILVLRDVSLAQTKLRLAKKLEEGCL
jgi:hypothetical protein